ncbi:MAG: glycosyltransferase family 2 protein [Ignavibacteriaceae bacterium]|nr:glycosyltransferase family 2 protein [Ignavibacteriaceae bacterium]
MLISIITPTFNSAKTIEETVKSIISQTYGNYEHIIVDNLSEDNTLKLITKIYDDLGILSKLKIISEKDDGISDAFNKGITTSSGEIVGIINSDDIFYDDSVLSLVNAALSAPNKLLAHGNIFFEDHIFGSNIRFPLKNKGVGVEFNHPGMFIKRELYKKIGLYKSDMHYAMDVDFFFRLKKEFSNIEDISSYINHPLVRMKAGGASWKNELKALKEVKISLLANDMWNFNTAKYYWVRIFRTRIKSFLAIMGLHMIVKIWRNLKWKGSLC